MSVKHEFEVRLLDDRGQLIEVALLQSGTEQDALMRATELVTNAGAADFQISPPSRFGCAYRSSHSRLRGYSG